MTNELSSFIESVHNEPYSLFRNNCINKSLRIKARAEELGKRADLNCCIAVLPVKKWHNFPIISPHVYSVIEGERIDVALDPEREERLNKNSEQRIIFPLNISRLARFFCRGSLRENLDAR